jgi:hypothetical protein
MEDSSPGMSSTILIEIVCDNGSLKTVRYGTLLASSVPQARSAPASVPVRPQTGHVRPAKKTLAINEHNLSAWSLLPANREGSLWNWVLRAPNAPVTLTKRGKCPTVRSPRRISMETATWRNRSKQIRKRRFGKLKVLLTIASKIQQGGRQITGKDVVHDRSKGATNKEIHDTVLTAVAVSMDNRRVDRPAAWAPTHPEIYRQDALRLADNGYGVSTERPVGA